MNEFLRSRRLATLGLFLALGAVGCGEENDNPGARSQPSPEATQLPKKQPTAEGPQLVFDDLGGGSSIIRVFPGVRMGAADKVANGTFNDGDEVPPECKIEGRTVHSDHSVGEENRQSNDWIKIQGTPGEEQYATAVYVENPEKLLNQLEDC